MHAIFCSVTTLASAEFPNQEENQRSDSSLALQAAAA
jgi:hypothetical protein